MSQVIMLLLFPIGFYFYFFVERKARPAYEKIFTDFEHKTQQSATLNDQEKIALFKEMLLINDYRIKEVTTYSVTAQRNIFSMSIFAMGVGLYFVGAVIYVLYFYFLQTTHKVVFNTSKN
jgi:hypothetical protein